MRVTRGLQQRNLPSPVWQQGSSGPTPSILSSEDLPHVDRVRIPEWQFEEQGVGAAAEQCLDRFS